MRRGQVKKSVDRKGRVGRWEEKRGTENKGEERREEKRREEKIRRKGLLHTVF